MVITSVTILSATMLGVWQEYRAACAQTDKQLRTLAEVTAYSLAAPSMFVDKAAAEKALDALSVDDQVVAARLILSDSETLASYRRQVSPENPSGLEVDGIVNVEVIVIQLNLKVRFQVTGSIPDSCFAEVNGILRDANFRIVV